MSQHVRLLLVRHGQSTWNADGRWQGTEDPPLSTLGVRQARRAAAAVGTFDAIVSSPLARAHTTASIIAEELGVGPVRVEHGLSERHAGEFQGLTKHEIEERFPGYLAGRRHPPGWEEDHVVVERAIATLASVAVDVGAGGSALVVSHGGVIGCLERLCGADRLQRLPNLGGRWFHIGSGTFDAGDDVLLVDLADLSVPGQL